MITPLLRKSSPYTSFGKASYMRPVRSSEQISASFFEQKKKTRTRGPHRSSYREKASFLTGREGKDV
jgi:hypothetical protein